MAHHLLCPRDATAAPRSKIPEQHLWTIRDGKVLRLQWFHDADEAVAPPAAAGRRTSQRLRAGYATFNETGDPAAPS